MHKWLPVNPEWPAQEQFDKIIDCCDMTKNLFKMLNSNTINAMGRSRVGGGGGGVKPHKNQTSTTKADVQMPAIWMYTVFGLNLYS